ncbi:MAG: hypothetical protein QXT20_03410 [Candidatus Woesearchaeota archaeon]
MEDTYLKVGILVVAVAVMGLLMAFAFKVIGAKPTREDELQNFSGSASQLYHKISRLCELCRGPAERDCFFITAEITEGVLNSSSNFEFQGFRSLAPGSYTLKIYSSSSKCLVRRME